MGAWAACCIAAALALAWCEGVARAAPSDGAPRAPVQLTVEYMAAPQGVDEAQPRFGFQPLQTTRGAEQTAYQIVVVAESGPSAGLVVWNSFRVASPLTQQIEYAGTALTPNTAYTWRVRWWDNLGDASPWSRTAKFTTGLFSPEGWAGAQWIGLTDQAPGNQLRTTFVVPSGQRVTRATAFVVGLGYYKLDIDGVRVSDHELGIFTTFAKRVMYHAWDATAAVSQGGVTHAVGVTLGHGWYAQPLVDAGPRSLLFRLAVETVNADGSPAGTVDVISDTSWVQSGGPIVYDDIYGGETYDARLETPGWTTAGFDASQWKPVQAVPPPSASVTISSHAVLPVIKRGAAYTPVRMWQVAGSPGSWVFDMGQNMAGYAVLHMPEGLATEPGVNITMQYAETTHGPPPAAVFHHYQHTAERATYITSGDGNAVDYVPQFTYFGFQFVQLTGYPGVPDVSTLTAYFVHTDVASTGSVTFSDSTLNTLQTMTRATSLSNLMMIPTDCPQRERRGWLGDAHISAQVTMYNFNMAGMYTSYVQAITDAQNKSGAVEDAVPWYHYGNDPADPAWGAAFTFLANDVWTFYNDTRLVQRQYPHLRAHTAFLIAEAAGTSDDGLLNFSHWGDWCPPSIPQECYTPSALVSTFMYLRQLRMVADMGELVGDTATAAQFSQLAANVSAAFQRHFYDATTKTYRDPGTTLSLQTATSLALVLGLVPEADKPAVVQSLVHDVMVTHSGHIATGMVGTKFLLVALTESGRPDVALAVSQVPTYPGWAYWVSQGATTLWENWGGQRYKPSGIGTSLNHVMFGSNGGWYYTHLAGITPGSSRGWRAFNVRPAIMASTGSSVCGQLSSVAASVVTPAGPVRVSWECAAKQQCALALNGGTAELGCEEGVGVLEKVEVATFGDPLGDCFAGLTVNASCNAPNSTAVVEAACVGKASCSVPASSSVFGNLACNQTPQLGIVMTGCSAGPRLFLNVTVPVGSTATVAVPLTGAASVATARVTESGTNVWVNGAYVPGTQGVLGATPGPAGSFTIDVTVAAGTYFFGSY